MKIATWNVNSVRARIDQVTRWLEQHEPDVLCLQETKVEDFEFPREPLEDEGYNVVVHGQTNYNGVAILAQHDIEDVVTGFPDDGDDAEARVLACRVGDFRVLNLYVPNGTAIGHEKYGEKLAWLGRLRAYLDAAFSPDEPLVVCGDFNITFDDRDVYDPDAMREHIHCSTPEREALADVMAFGLTDALRHFHDEAGIYTWWHYRAGGFERDLGMRIDHHLVTAPALERCRGVEVDVEARRGKGTSDHAPVIATF